MRDADVCVFVSYAPDAAIRPHVRFHIDALHAQGLNVVLFLNVERLEGRDRPARIDTASGIVMRTNAGFDFGAWADAFRIMPELWSARSLLLVNDSVLPVGDIGPMFSRIKASSSDVIGLTENYQFARHLQSYFTVYNRGALRNENLRRFWRSVVNLTRKWEVIRKYEVEMLARYLSMGLTCEVIFATAGEGKEQVNPTPSMWRELAAAGFPYLKGNVVRHMAKVNFTGWREIVANPRLVSIFENEMRAARTAG